ncbi:MAG: hypothetical protein QXZ17_01030, partial [Nitrososphaerota archaeon]
MSYSEYKPRPTLREYCQSKKYEDLEPEFKIARRFFEVFGFTTESEDLLYRLGRTGAEEILTAVSLGISKELALRIYLNMRKYFDSVKGNFARKREFYERNKLVGEPLVIEMLDERSGKNITAKVFAVTEPNHGVLLRYFQDNYNPFARPTLGFRLRDACPFYQKT